MQQADDFVAANVGIDFKGSWVSAANERETHKFRCTFKFAIAAISPFRKMG
jgi:hypothetical protein